MYKSSSSNFFLHSQNNEKFSLVLTWGSVLRNGPMTKRITRRNVHEKKAVRSVTPPDASWISERDKEAATGPHEKNEPNTLEKPCERCLIRPSFLIIWNKKASILLHRYVSLCSDISHELDHTLVTCLETHSVLFIL